MADLGHGDDALDADAVRIHRVDDRVQIGAVSALNLKLNIKPISSHPSFIRVCKYIFLYICIEQKSGSL